MERKSSLVIGPRTRQNILKGKVVRKLEDGCDNFEDYWTDSDGESSTMSKSSIHSSEMPNEESSNNASHVRKTRYSSLKSKAAHSPLKSKAVHSPLKSKAVHSPLKSKAVHSPLKSKAVHSPLKSKAVHSPLKSKAVHSPLKSKAVHSPLKSKAVHSPLKSKAVHSPLKSKAVHSPLKSKAVHSPLKSKAVHSPLKSKAVHSPLKSKAVHSPLKSKAVHSPLKSKAVHSPLKPKAVHSPLKPKAVHSPLKPKAVHSPLKPKAVHSPLKPKAVHSPLKPKAVHSPLKSKRVLYNDTENTDGVVNVNKESSTIEFQDTTVNLGVDDNNPESEALNEALANIARNKLPKVSSGEIHEIHNANNPPLSCISNVAEFQEIHSINYSPLSRTYNKKSDLLVSKISFKSSKKSISRSTKKDAKIKELQSQYDEYDEKIMQMIRMNDNENERTSNSSQEEMHLTEENSYFMGERKEKSKVKKQTVKLSRNIQSKKFFADDESPNESIYRNSRSVNQNINDSESLSFENIQMKKTEDTSKSKKNKSSKKTLTVDSSHTADISVNSDEDLSHFESDTDTGKTQADKQTAISKNSLPDNHLNTHMNSPGSTSDVINSDTDSPSKNTRKQKKNTNEDSSYSESDIDTGEKQADKQTAVNKNSVPDNHLNTHINSPRSTSDIINSNTDSPSKNTRKNMKNNVQNIFADQHSSKNVIPQKSVPSFPDSKPFLKKSKLHKNDALCRSKVAVEINDSNNDNIDDISKSASEDTSSNIGNNNTYEVCMIEKEKTTTNNKTDFIPDENNLDVASFNESSHFQTLRRRKTFVNKSGSIPGGNDVANTSVNFSEDSIDVSEVNMEKPAKKLKKNENDKNRHKETNRKSCFIPHEDMIETADVDSSSERQTSTRRKTRNRSVSEENDVANKSVNFSEDSVDVSEVNVEKPPKKLKKNENDKNRQSETNSKSCFISHEDFIETADVDNSSERQSSTRRKTRNRSVSEENDVANTSMNFPEKSVSVSKVNMEKTKKKQRKDKHGKMRQKETNKTSCFIPYEDNVETADLDSHSQSQTSKRRRTRNSSIIEENDFVNLPLNYSKNSVNCFDEINHKKTNKEQRKIEKYKSRQKSASNKSDFIPVKDIVEKDDLSLSNSSHHTSVNIKKTAKEQRKSKISKSDDAQKTSDSSQQQTKRQKTSVTPRNNFISEENDQADGSINSSENGSVNNFSVITKKKNPKKQKKVESDKGRPLHDESDIEDENQSQVRASKKSNLGKNNMNKENEKSNHAPIRRSTRERFTPLARWRNERLCYGFRDGNIETFGVDKGTNEDPILSKWFYKNNQKQKIKKPKPVEILDIAENKKKRVHLLKKFPLIPWDSPLRCKTDENPSHAFLIKRMLETKKNSFGYVHIDVHKTKPPQYMPEEDLLLTAIEGRVEINLHDKIYVLENKDMFIVPRGTAYNITNISKKRALLSYVVGKFKFLDDF